MTKKDFIEKVATNSGVSRKDCKTVLDAVLEEIVNAIKDEGEIRFAGFGSFKKVLRPGRKMHSALAGREVEIKEKNVIKTKFSDSVIEKINS